MDRVAVEGGCARWMRWDQSCGIELSWNNEGFEEKMSVVVKMVLLVIKWHRERRKEGRKENI